MADSDFWRALALSFRELQKECLEPLAAEWIPVRMTEGTRIFTKLVWGLRGPSSCQVRFTELAKVAFARFAPDEVDKLSSWLNKLNAENPHLSKPKEHDGGGRIDHVANASAEYCERLYQGNVLAATFPQTRITTPAPTHSPVPSRLVWAIGPKPEAQGSKLETPMPPKVAVPNRATNKKTRQRSEPHPELLKDKETVNKTQAAQALGISTRTLDRYVKEEKLSPVGAFGQRRYKTKDLISFIKQRDK